MKQETQADAKPCGEKVYKMHSFSEKYNLLFIGKLWNLYMKMILPKHIELKLIWDVINIDQYRCAAFVRCMCVGRGSAELFPMPI